MGSGSFDLDPRLEQSSRVVADLALCHVRLSSDGRWPWLLLMPRREGVTELEQLSPDELAALTAEIIVAGRAVRAIGQAWGRPVEKLNVAAIGNIVPQLHVHVVGRRADDLAWPGPVWGFGAAEPLTEERAAPAVSAALGVLAP